MKPYIVQNENALYYECGFSCDNAIFLRFSSNEAYFLTDGRYVAEAKENIINAEVVNAERDLVKKARDIIKKARLKFIIFDPLEFSVAKFDALSKTLNATFTPQKNFSQKKRIIKTPKEIELIETAAKIGRDSFCRFAQILKTCGFDKNEQELHYEAEISMRFGGQNELSFQPICAINENSAKPHALPNQNKMLKNGDLLLLDAGVKYRRYCSDRTRTAQIGSEAAFDDKNKQKFEDSFRQKIYDIVLKAQKAAIDAVKVGVRASDVDKAARDVIEKAGFGKYFIHSTGHGVGLDIHELPVISPYGDAIIEEGMVFTVEPGIYLPNEFGVRIEDMVAIVDGKAKVLHGDK
ncbi:MAG: aminopeptidase P family protein [Campylobacteraceae bacterium]|nr:aminopeptidase P family protein [Campylobacteraceae bacterium]